MKRIFIILAVVLITIKVWAQSPEKMSYQAVIRDANNNLVTNQTVGIQISILQTTASGTSVYTETQTPTTNANGLVSLEIGAGISLDDFSTIDWSADTYFIKTETDPTGGTNYTITGTSQLLSVPYALHAKTAGTLTGAITENDPVYTASQAANIDSTDITNLGNLTGVNTGDQDLSILATKTALSDSTAQLRTEIPDVSIYLSSETDPVYTASQAANIDSTDIINLGNLTGVNTGDQDLSTLATKTALSDSTAQVRSEIPDVSGFISSETDPNVPTGTQIGQMQYWNGTAWVTVASGNNGQRLTFVDGVPIWVDNDAKVSTSGQIFKDVTSLTGKVWMDRNLGASQVATSSTDSDAYGDMYQWGRAADGHQLRTSGITNILATNDTTGHSYFIIVGSNPYDWRSTQNNNLWQGESGTNNPCPSGYRLPTKVEWESERLSWSNNNTVGAFASPLKLTKTGYRNYNNGIIYNVGSVGRYWSSSVDSTGARYLTFFSSFAGIGSYHRAAGYSVRCIKD